MPRLDLTHLAYAFGRLAGATCFASSEIRKVAALTTVSDAWRAYRRDAGAGDVGPAHQASADSMSILLTDDPRRDAVLLWLADHGVPAIAAPAATLARMVDATRRFASDELALLDTAQIALFAASTTGPLAIALGLAGLDADHSLQSIAPAVGAVDILFDHPNFAEHQGHDAMLDLPGGPLHRHVAAPPSGCWALNLALLSHNAGVVPGLAGQLPRAVFRLDLTVQERTEALVKHCEHTARGGFDRLTLINRRCVRGIEALAGLSRNARAREAWALIVAVGPLRRIQLARALGLSRAGADIQAHALARAGLVTLVAGGRIQPTQRQLIVEQPAILDDGPLALATAALDASMADIDRLLERSTRV